MAARALQGFVSHLALAARPIASWTVGALDDVGASWVPLGSAGSGEIAGQRDDAWRDGVATLGAGPIELGTLDTGVAADGTTLVAPGLQGFAWKASRRSEPAPVLLQRFALSLDASVIDGRWHITARIDIARADAANPAAHESVTHDLKLAIVWYAVAADAVVRAHVAGDGSRQVVPGKPGYDDVAVVPSGFALNVGGLDETLAVGAAPSAYDAETGLVTLATSPSDVSSSCDVALVHLHHAVPQTSGPVSFAADTIDDIVTRVVPISWPRSGESRAGFARAAFSFAAGKPLAGYSLGSSGKGMWTRNPCYARAAYFEDPGGNRVVFVVIDMHAASRLLHERVAEITAASVGLGVADIVLAGTHTHTAPGGFYGNSLYNTLASHAWGADEELVTHCTHVIASAIEAAVRAAEPANVRVDVERVWGISRNRSQPAFQKNESGGWARWLTDSRYPGFGAPAGLSSEQAQVDPRVVVLSAFATKGPRAGRRIGGFATFACHNNALGSRAPQGGMHAYDPDWCGVAATQSERDPEGAPVMLVGLSGAGDQSPLPPERGSYDGPHGQGDKLVDFVGGRVAAAIAKTGRDASGAQPIALKVRHADWWTTGHKVGDPDWNKLPHPLAGWAFGASTLAGSEEGRSALYPLLAHEGMTSANDFKGSPQFPKARALGFLQPFARDAAKLAPSPVRSIHVVQIAGHTYATVPGEPTAWAAYQVAEHVRLVTGTKTASVIGYAGDYGGYFTTTAEFSAQHYEGASTLFGGQSLNHLAERLARLAASPARATARFTASFSGPGDPEVGSFQPASGRVDEHQLVAYWMFPEGTQPKQVPVVVAFEEKGGVLTALNTPEAIRVEPRVTYAQGQKVALWIATIPVAGSTEKRKFEIRAGSLPPVKLPQQVVALSADSAAVPEAFGDMSVDELKALLKQQPDQGRALLAAILGREAGARLWNQLFGPVAFGLFTPQVDPAQLAAFKVRWIDGHVTTTFDVKAVESRDFEDSIIPGDGIKYAVSRGAIAYHTGQIELVDALFPKMTPDELTYELKQNGALAKEADILLFADFGNGLYMPRVMGEVMAKGTYDAAVHLGDVYFSGTEKEFPPYFTEPLQALRDKTELFVLTGNHEMYNKGICFQDFILNAKGKVPRRQKAETFRLKGDGFQLLGIDQMFEYKRDGLTKAHARFGPEALKFLETWANEPKDDQELTILLTADEPWDLGETSTRGLLEDVKDLVAASKIDLWFWGNVHYAALYEPWQYLHPKTHGFVGSCIGHGGFPFEKQKGKKKMPPRVVTRWLETENRFWPMKNVRPDMGLNGFCEMKVRGQRDDWRVELLYRDWVGRDRCRATVTKKSGTLSIPLCDETVFHPITDRIKFPTDP